MFEFFERAVRNLISGAASSALAWLSWLGRRLIVAFFAGGAVTGLVAAGVAYSQNQGAPSHTGWLVIGLIAVIGALVTVMGTAVLLIVRSLLRLVRSAGSGSLFGSHSPTPTPSNVRRFPSGRDRDSRVG